MLRIFAGLIGGRLFYARYGYFPGEPPGKPKVTFKSWFLSAWKYLVLIAVALVSAQWIMWKIHWTIIIFLWPFLMVVFLLIAVVLVHRPKTSPARGKTFRHGVEQAVEQKGASHNVLIPAVLTLVVAAAIFLINPSVEMLWVMLLLGLPMFIALFGVFYGLGIVIRWWRQRPTR